MGKIKVTEDCNGIAGLKVIEPSVFGDKRGYFMETYNYNDFKEAGIDVAVDLREGSETFGKWFGVTLSAENKKQFFIPKGFAHGFVVLSDYAEFCYKVTDFYHPNDEGGLLWKDPEIGVEWPMPEGMTEADLILSDKDKVWGGIKEYVAAKAK